MSPIFAKSIRGRLLLWLGSLLACVLIGFGFTAYQLHRLNQFHQIDQELERRVAALSIAARVRPPFGMPTQHPFFGPFLGPMPLPDSNTNAPRPGLGPEHAQQLPGEPLIREGPYEHFGRHGPPGPREIHLPVQTASLFNETDTNAFFYAIWSSHGALLKQSTNSPPNLHLPKKPGRDTATHIQMRDDYREAFHFTEFGDCILTGRSIVRDLEATRHFTWWLFAAGGGVLALGLGGTGWLVTRAIRPVNEISAAASRISGGNLSERINLSDTASELGRLGSVLNSTFARLDTAFRQQKQFTGDASHELRTPLAVIISEAQTALARERNGPEYRETIEVCLDAAQQMRKLTESLLDLARFDAGHDQMDQVPVDLASVAMAASGLVEPLAASRKVTILRALSPARLSGDADRLSQVFTNLLTNAIFYNKESGEIRISTGLKDGKAIATVSDTGQGIGDEDLPHVFERFYRADKSRSRASGRSGLGLAITKAIVDAHGGKIAVRSKIGSGTTFEVEFPSLDSAESAKVDSEQNP